MFKCKERLDKLEYKIVKLESYCAALENEQNGIYSVLHKGMEFEQAEYDKILLMLETSIKNRKKAFEAFQE